MSTFDDPSPPGHHRPSTNGLGIAGFVVSLVGMLGACVGAAVLSPVGLILSAIALRRVPRGLAIAGLMLGIIGSVLLMIAVLFTGGVRLTPLMGAGEQERKTDLLMGTNVSQFYAANSRLPVSLAELAVTYPDTPLTDVNGSAIGYSVMSPTECAFIFPGDDGVLGTRDDRYNVVATARTGGVGGAAAAGVGVAPGLGGGGPVAAPAAPATPRSP
jgi:hypothetical protein